MLGGVRFADGCGLEGHSDADALIHASVDALLGAAGLGDIGEHFPNTDPRWRDAPSLEFLRFAAARLKDAGWTVLNLDCTVIAERPRILERVGDIRSAMSAAMNAEYDRISVKATTNERMGAVGREEGIAAVAVATIRQTH
jgi:2-C-methyl-D-erythritol 2,4-cyclodiphosphate synthase